MPATRFVVPATRDSRIRAFDFSFHRCATGSPARCTTASRPLSASAGAGPAPGSHATASTPSFSRAFAGSRDSTVTSSPRPFSAATSRVPINPVAPVTVTFMAAPG